VLIRKLETAATHKDTTIKKVCGNREARELRWAHDLDDAMSGDADDLDRRPVLPVRQQVPREDELEC